MNKVYAVGIASGWVQLRTASGPPKAVKSSVEIEVEEKPKNRIYCVNPDQPPWQQQWRVRKVKARPKTLHMTHVIHKGGKVIKTMTHRKFATLLHIPLELGGVVELDEGQALKALGKVEYEKIQAHA